MTKTIHIHMTNARREEIAGQRGRYETALYPVEIDLDTLTPAARWIAEHITSTYVNDEARNTIGIIAVAGYSMAERDRRAGKSEEYIARLSEGYEESYTKEPMRANVTFPIYGKMFRRPEDVIEEAVKQLRKAGAVKLEAANGDVYQL